MALLQQLFEQSTDAVFGIDLHRRIRFWNHGCERLLGHSGEDVCGARCYEVLQGTDLQGNPHCGPECPIPRVVADEPLVGDFDLVVSRGDGDTALVNIGTCYTPSALRRENDDIAVFHGLRQIRPQRILQRMVADSGEDATHRNRYDLTPREVEILGHASSGLKTTTIAQRLFISSQTVRNHFKNIYPKLGVHTRSEAVAVALRRGLVS